MEQVTFSSIGDFDAVSLAAKTRPPVDEAYVGSFFALLEGDVGHLRSALADFADGCLESDWGRHKPLMRHGAPTRQMAPRVGLEVGRQ